MIELNFELRCGPAANVSTRELTVASILLGIE